MINLLVKVLSESDLITDFMIHENVTHSIQSFYVMQKLETTRLVDTKEYHITVYKNFTLKGIQYTGSSSFALSHKMTRKEIEEKIKEAAYAASFVKNKPYALVQAVKKRSWSDQKYNIEPFQLLDQIAQTFFAQSKPNLRFNSLELFYNMLVKRIVSSRGVDYKKTQYQTQIEVIPSYDGQDDKVELYKFYTHKTIDFKTIENNAKQALEDVKTRYLAKPFKDIKKVDVILREEDLKELIENIIEDYSYESIYRKNTEKVIGDAIQSNVTGEFLNIDLKPSSRADGFDQDGVLLAPIHVITDGIITNYYGSNQYAQYLDMKPNGMLKTISLPKGMSSHKKMTKDVHLEIIALSGIQIDMYSGYIGGEVRLAVYFDGKTHHPVSGFSFSGHIEQSLSTLSFSKEMIKIAGYEGPKYIKLLNMDIL